MNYVLAAALTNLSYALADVGNGFVAKKNSSIKVSLWVALFACAIFAIPMFVSFQDELDRLTPANVVWILGVGSLGNLGYLCFVTGMNRGSVTLTGVIAGAFPVVSTFVALLFFNERVSAPQAGAIAAVLVGVVLSSLEGNLDTLIRDIRTSALVFAFGAMLLFGTFFALVRIPVEKVGWFLPQYLPNYLGLLLYFVIGRSFGEKDLLRRPPRLIGVVVFLAAIQISGSMFYSYALTKGETAIVAPIAGSSPAIFVILAYFIFKERIKAIQWAGIVTAVAGIVALSVLSG